MISLLSREYGLCGVSEGYAFHFLLFESQLSLNFTGKTATNKLVILLKTEEGFVRVEFKLGS
jgi:hypothetical protein